MIKRNIAARRYRQERGLGKPEPRATEGYKAPASLDVRAVPQYRHLSLAMRKSSSLTNSITQKFRPDLFKVSLIIDYCTSVILPFCFLQQPTELYHELRYKLSYNLAVPLEFVMQPGYGSRYGKLKSLACLWVQFS